MSEKPRESETRQGGGMSEEEIKKAKARMDRYQYEDGKLVEKKEESSDKREGAEARQREEIIAGLVKHQIETEKDSIIDQERAKEYWENFYDNATQGQKMDMQVNEIYAQRYEKGLAKKKDDLAILEEKLRLADTKSEEKNIQGQIEQLKEYIAENEKDVIERRGFLKPKKQK